MAYQIEQPTESDFAAGHRLMRLGSMLMLGAMGVLGGIAFVYAQPLSTWLERIQATAAGVLSLGLATVLWGLRVYATQAEYESARKNNGLTPAYEAACTMLSILFVIVPVCALLIALGVIELPTYPSSRGG